MIKALSISFFIFIIASCATTKNASKVIEGVYEVSCGSCNFDMTGEGCELAIKIDGKFYYVAEVSHNPDPTYFEMTSISDNGFICENPDHDFPKKITYKLENGVLIATISGNGKEIAFVFKRE